MPRPRFRIPRRASALSACALLFSGCLYTTHHFNSGRLLDPGQSALTLGAGPFRSLHYGCPDGGPYDYIYEVRDSTGSRCVHPSGTGGSNGDYSSRIDTVGYVHGWNSTWKGSLGYRLGVHGRFGPFTGAEIGLHLEAPTNPASAEFDLKLGLPVPAGWPYHHSWSTGFGTGAWADNSYFGEYAISRALGAGDLFANYRATYLATQIGDLKGSDSRRRFASRQRLFHQASLGFRWDLASVRGVPDYVVPLIVLTYPLAPVGTGDRPPAYLLDDHVFDFGLGIGWRFH